MCVFFLRCFSFNIFSDRTGITIYNREEYTREIIPGACATVLRSVMQIVLSSAGMGVRKMAEFYMFWPGLEAGQLAQYFIKLGNTSSNCMIFCMFVSSDTPSASHNRFIKKIEVRKPLRARERKKNWYYCQTKLIHMISCLLME